MISVRLRLTARQLMPYETHFECHDLSYVLAIRKNELESAIAIIYHHNLFAMLSLLFTFDVASVFEV